MGCTSSVSVATAPAARTQEQFLEKYKMGKELGRGAFAKVIEATEPASGMLVAVKVLNTTTPKRPSQTDDSQAEFKNKQLKLAADGEAMIWTRIGKHPNCVQLLEVFQGTGLCFMTMEKCEGTLVQKLMDIPTLTEDILAHTVRDMLLGLDHIHKLGIVHRDVKPENYLYTADENIKLCDFGLAELIPQSGKKKLKGVVGTPPYMSPEMVMKKGHDQSTDMWSLGVLLYLFMFGDFPYVPAVKSGAAMKEAIRSGPPPSFLGDHSVEAASFVRALLRRSPNDRLNAEDALALPYMSPEPTTANGYSSEGSVCARPDRQRTTDFCDQEDPTVQTDIQELLAKLLPSFRRSFSEQLDGSKSEITASKSCATIISRRSSRPSTHTGCTSLDLTAALEFTKGNYDDEVSTTDADSKGDAGPRNAGDANQIIGKITTHVDTNMPDEESW